MTILEEKFSSFISNQEDDIKSLKQQLEKLSASTLQVNLLAEKVQKYATEQVFTLNRRLESEEDLPQVIRDMGQIIMDLNSIVKLEARGLGLSIASLISKVNEKQESISRISNLKNEIKEKEERMKEAANKIARGEKRKMAERPEKLSDIRKYAETEQE
jgi:hypothetical protein